MTEFHFLRPAWLLALPVVLALVWLAWHRVRGGARWQSVIDPGLLPWLLDDSTATTWKRSYALLLLGWLIAVIALAGPAWEKLPSPVQRKLDQQVVLFDLSVSMYAQDIRPSRLERARYKLQDLLRQRREGQTALVAYAGDAFTVTPFTDDQATILNQVQALDPRLMPALGSRLSSALKETERLLEGQAGAPVRILLITDEVRENELETAARWLKKRGIPMDVLAVGTAAGAPIPLPGGDFARDQAGQLVTPAVNIAALRTLAEDSGGRFQLLRADNADVAALLRDPVAWQKSGESEPGRTADTYRDAGVWLLLVLLPLAALGFRRGYLGLLPFLLFALPPQPAQAFDWRDLWQRSDQQALQTFQSEDYEAASETFRDPEWQASALYRAGRPEEAAARLADIDNARAHYNRGNALARAQQFEAALEAYDRALALDPGNEDARANRELVRRLLEEQQQEQESQSGPKDDEEQESAEQQDSQKQGGEQSDSDGQAQDQGGSSQSDSEPDTADQASEAATPPREEAPADEEEPASSAEAESAQAQEDAAENAEAAEAAASERTDAENDQALEQWLRRIPDDPSALLRRKFLWQYQRRANPSSTTDEGQYW